MNKIPANIQIQRDAISGQSHFLPRKLGLKYDTTAFWAFNPNKTVIIFVHGFGGNAIDTWNNFFSLLPSDNKMNNIDIIFWGYDALKKRAHVSSLQFFDFLDKLYSNPTKFINFDISKEYQRDDRFRYNNIIVIAHSLGAVIVRKTLLEAFKTNSKWASKTKMCLYAPAHKGADILKLAKEAVNPLLRLKIINKYTVLHDLDVNSNTILELSKDTAKALKKKNSSYLIAENILLAENDDVINPNPFCSDKKADLILKLNHSSICKPKKRTEKIYKKIVEIV